MGGTCHDVAARKGCSAASMSTWGNHHGSRGNHLPSASPGIRRDAEPQAGLVGLVGIQEIGRELGGFAKAEGSSPEARGSGCPYAHPWRRKKTPRPLQSVIGGQAHRLVEQEHAVDLPPGLLRLGLRHERLQSSGVWSLRALAWSISWERLVPRSTDVS